MSCERTSAVSLLVVALLISSLLTPHLPIACARHVVALKANNGLNIIGHVVSEFTISDERRTKMERELVGQNYYEDFATKEPSVSTGDLAAGKKGSEGRKLGARDMEETEAVGMKEAPDKKEKADTVANAGALPRTTQMHSVTTKHRDAASELYDMLTRDYASRASRRPPIHNGEAPLQEEP